MKAEPAIKTKVAYDGFSFWYHGQSYGPYHTRAALRRAVRAVLREIERLALSRGIELSTYQSIKRRLKHDYQQFLKQQFGSHHRGRTAAALTNEVRTNEQAT